MGNSNKQRGHKFHKKQEQEIMSAVIYHHQQSIYNLSLYCADNFFFLLTCKYTKWYRNSLKTMGKLKF